MNNLSIIRDKLTVRVKRSYLFIYLFIVIKDRLAKIILSLVEDNEFLGYTLLLGGVKKGQTPACLVFSFNTI